MPSTRIDFLIDKYFQSSCSEEELQELMEWVDASSETELGQKLAGIWKNFSSDTSMPEEMSERILTNIFNHEEEEHPIEEEYREPSFWRTTYGMAASVALIISFGFFGWLQYNANLKRTENRIVEVKSFEQHDVLPGGDKAVLTLDDGSKVVLDNSANGSLGKQGETDIRKTQSGKVVYEGGQVAVAKPMFNTLTTPKGGQYQVVLSDGTKVWLNAASSLRFPTAFTGNERRVEMTGEVYFEVAKNPKMPFKVITQGQEVEVLGTHFNVMAFQNEKVIKTTLLEGSVKVSNNEKTAVLQPGQQSKVGINSNIFRTVNDVNIEEELAWKNGYFQFNDASLEQVMRQIERWYDVDIEYVGKIPNEHFTGKLPRNTNLSNVLKILSMSEVEFKIEGKKIIITP
ncbi:FecR family protein [Cellulophaga sp. BC115SP]|uniref:FecR family protein n=1 Tax=Cellulophaga sp. BC115SP TaxID=2683263 RepID=UPI00141302DC|nr:FecR family protein [Cellulophaga sp. BC115SP]NBB30070.1 DUF4974 domain-containing protein [Cellulophaga sp. BC115SP]